MLLSRKRSHSPYVQKTKETNVTRYVVVLIVYILLY